MGKGEGEKKIEKKTLGQILSQAAGSAFRGGIPGLIAMFVQVLALMWMRTLVNYQYSKGGTFFSAFSTLYAEGGISRFYAGLLPVTSPDDPRSAARCLVCLVVLSRSCDLRLARARTEHRVRRPPPPRRRR